MLDAVQVISSELKLPPEKVAGAVELLREGATVPFLARYRKERVGSLNEEQLYDIKERLGALVSLEARRSVVLSSIKAQDKLTDELRAKIDVAVSRTALEDLYQPYTPKRKSPGAAAKAQGLEPLADQILKQEATGSAEDLAAPFLSAEKGVKETTAALKGARAIIAERLAEDPGVRAAVRELIWNEGKLTTQAAANVALERTKYSSYGNFTEPLAKLPSHRILAVLRGESEKKLKIVLDVPREKIVELLRSRVSIKPESAFAGELTAALDECLSGFLMPALEDETRNELKTHSSCRRWRTRRATN
jgi:protein Tex